MIRLLSVFFLCAGITIAQSQSDSLSLNLAQQQQSFLQSSFTKQQNTFNFGGTGMFFYTSPLYFIFLKEDYNSTVIRSEDMNIKESQFTSFKTGYLFADNISGGVMLNRSIYSDSRKIAINSSSQQYLEVFGRYALQKDDYAAISGGFAKNGQVGQVDNGFIIESEGLLKNLHLFDTDLLSTWKLREEQINPRKNYVRKAQLLFSNQFENSLSNELGVQYEEQRNDFYVPIDSITNAGRNVQNNVQQRIESVFGFSDKLSNLHLINQLTASLAGNFSARKINRSYLYTSLSSFSASTVPNQIDELKFESEGNLRFATELQESRLRIYYSQRDEKHQIPSKENIPENKYDDLQTTELMKNNASARITLVGSSVWKLSTKDKLSINISHNKLAYDTQSSDNFDDRDELLTIARLDYERKITPFFTLFSQIEGNLSHLVYLFSEKSSNNNKNRVLRFRGGGNYDGAKFNSANIFEITANYTTFDFEDINPNYQSYSYRQMVLTDSSEYRCTQKFSVRVQTVLKFSEQGNLTWKNFSIKQTRTNEEIFFHPEFVSSTENLQFVVGFRYYAVKTFTFPGKTKVPETQFYSTGPTSEVHYAVSDKTNISFSGGYEFISHGNGIEDHRSNFQLTVLMKI